jgi:hypothetical protein
MVGKKGYIGMLFLLVLFACNTTTVNTYEEYLAWLNDSENGLTMDKKAGGIIIKVKHLPSNYLAYQDLLHQSQVNKDIVDSLINNYDKSLTFLLNIGVDGNTKKGDVMYHDVKNYEEYKKKLYNMNFDIEKNISLTINEKEYFPVLAHLENVYGLTESRNIMVVFVPETENEQSFYDAKEIAFTYDDELFNTGISHFVFKRKNINNIPSFIFWN